MNQYNESQIELAIRKSVHTKEYADVVIERVFQILKGDAKWMLESKWRV